MYFYERVFSNWQLRHFYPQPFRLSQAPFTAPISKLARFPAVKPVRAAQCFGIAARPQRRDGAPADGAQAGGVRCVMAERQEQPGALASRIAALREIAARVQGKARLTLDPSERHGFEYQTWFGFMIYADGVPGSLGRGGSYRITPSNEPAIGFSLYPDRLIDALAAAEPQRDMLFLPLGHDAAHAARLRAIGWRTVAALGPGCDAKALGCTHRLEAGEARKL